MRTITALFIKYRYIIFVLFLAILAGWPLLHSGLIPTHDGEYHLIRFYEFDKMLRTGNLYPRWAPDLNFDYGIPLLTYVYPLPNYIASFFHFFGASFLDSVKLNMFFASTIGALLFFLWIKRFWGNFGALVGATVYTFAPYHFVDIYVRGSVGEVWALGLFPGFLWAFTEFVETQKMRFFLLSSLFLALIIFSHNILGLMFFFFAMSYMLLLVFTSKEKKALLFHSLLILLLSLGLSSIFWIPALFETKYVTGLQVFSLYQNFPDITQLLFPSWGTDFFGSGTGNEMSVQIGLSNILAVILACFIFFKKHGRERLLIGFFLVWFFILVFLMLPYSIFIWKTIPLMNYFQFPWRFLSLVILVCGFLAGFLVKIRFGKIIGTFFILLSIILTLSYTHPAYYMIRNDAYYLTRSNFIDGTNSPGNVFNTIWNKEKTSRPESFFVPDKHTVSEKIIKISPTKIGTVISTNAPTVMTANISYFPSWSVVSGRKAISAFQTNGLLSFKLGRGVHTVSISNRQTAIEAFAASLSFVTLVILCTYCVLRKQKF